MSSDGAASVVQRPALPRGRRWFVYAVAAAIIGGHAVMIAFRGEFWPFSRYPMYSDAKRDQVALQLQLFGVTDGAKGTGGEISFQPGFLPLKEVVLRTGMRRTLQTGNTRQLELMLADTLGWYEQRRQAGAHGGPPIRGIRLYELRWEGDPRKRESMEPDDRRLISEVMEPA